MSEDNKENTPPVQVVHHNHTVVPFEWAVQKLFEPVLNDLGQDMVSIKRKVGRVVATAIKKLKPEQEEWKTNARVAWNVISEASFTDSEIGAEYFGGILAASKTKDGTDDTGIYYLQIAKSLSSKQLYLHYILYKSLNNLFIKDDSNKTLNVGMGSELGRKGVYFFAVELINLGVNIDTDFQALSANSLIAQHWELTEITATHPITGIETKVYQAFFTPTTLGIQLMTIAQNRLDEYRTFNVVDFGTFENIEIPEFCAFSVEDLLKKTMIKNVHEIVINKNVSEVFEFTTNPDNTPKWIDTIKEEKIDSTPITIGTKYSNTTDGTNWTEYVCRAFDKDSLFELQEGSDLYHVRYTYEKVSDIETKLTYLEWMDGGVIPLPNPFEKRHLLKLKEVMESPV